MKFSNQLFGPIFHFSNFELIYNHLDILSATKRHNTLSLTYLPLVVQIGPMKVVMILFRVIKGMLNPSYLYLIHVHIATVYLHLHTISQIFAIFTFLWYSDITHAYID